jgi:hypothetical protein
MSTLIAAKPAEITIPKLTTANYKIWSELIVEALDGRGVWDCVNGTEKKPKDDPGKVWQHNNAIAAGIIKGALSESQLGHVIGVRDAKEIWATLKRIHQTTDEARVQSLIAEFIQFRLCTTIDEGASTLTRLQSEIGILDNESKPSDVVKVQTLLAGLGSEYESTLAALQASKIKKFEEVVAQLKMAEIRLKGQGWTKEDQNLVRRTIGPNRPRIIKERTCFHCGETGHFIKECEEFLAEIRQQILDEQREGMHQERNQRTARSARRTTGSSEGFRARGVSHEPDISERAW